GEWRGSDSSAMRLLPQSASSRPSNSGQNSRAFFIEIMGGELQESRDGVQRLLPDLRDAGLRGGVSRDQQEEGPLVPGAPQDLVQEVHGARRVGERGEPHP